MMEFKQIGAAVAVAGALAFPLVACGSGSSTPAPTVTVTSAPTTLSPGFRDSYCNINSATREACRQSDSTAAKRAATAQAPRSQDSGLPWWSWVLIVPAGLALFAFLAIKLMDANDERTISRAQARVAELDARPRPVVDYDDYEDDDGDDDLDEEDMAFLHRVTDPAPAPVQPAPPADGGLLSSLRQQNQ